MSAPKNACVGGYPDLGDVIDENRFVFIIVYVNQRRPLQFQSKQKEEPAELLRIMSVETELNNTVNKTHI